MNNNERSGWKVIGLSAAAFLLAGMTLHQLNSRSLTAAIRNACINNLRQIEGAKESWALTNKKAGDATPAEADLALHLKDGKLPQCPGGGAYTFGRVRDQARCSIEGHTLPASYHGRNQPGPLPGNPVIPGL